MLKLGDLVSIKEEARFLYLSNSHGRFRITGIDYDGEPADENIRRVFALPEGSEIEVELLPKTIYTSGAEYPPVI